MLLVFPSLFEFVCESQFYSSLELNSFFFFVWTRPDLDLLSRRCEERYEQRERTDTLSLLFIKKSAPH